MSEPGWVRAYRVVFAALTLAAIVYQIAFSADRDNFAPANFFSYFTIQSNIIGAVVFLLGASAMASRSSSLSWDLIRGGAAMYLTTTFFVYGILLAGLDDSLQTPVPWVNFVLHRLFPVVVVADLLLRPLAHRITFRQALVWAIYPMLYLAYSLVRGPIVDWYPYPFLNPDESGGYLGVAGYSVVILVGFLIFTAAIVWSSQHLRLDIHDDATKR